MSWKRMRRRSPRVEKGWKILWINCSRPWTVCRRTWGQWLIDWSLWRFRQCKRKSQSSDRRCRRRAIWPLWLLLPLWICHQEFCHHLRHHLWHLPWHRHSPCPDFKAVQDAIWLVDQFRSSSTRLQTLRCSMILKMIPTRWDICWPQVGPIISKWVWTESTNQSRWFISIRSCFLSILQQFHVWYPSIWRLKSTTWAGKTPVGWQHLVFVAWFEYLHLNIKFKDVLFPLVGWLLEGFEEPPEKQQVNDYRWYTKPAPLHCVLVKPRLFEVNSAFLRLQSPFLLVRPTITKPWVFTKINR